MSYTPGDKVRIHPSYAHTDAQAKHIIGREGTVIGHEGDFIQVNVPDSSPYNDSWLFYDSELEPVAS